MSRAVERCADSSLTDKFPSEPRPLLGRANKVEQGVSSPVNRCIVEVSGQFSLSSSREEQGGMSSCTLKPLV
ncbi:hypothetical protein NQZ68_011379 [Dissostichus eleginoides]|nr:hypothetical protein NQZ68_011379 [Dissostichus eleginoides]